jgi:hypothetical protein
MFPSGSGASRQFQAMSDYKHLETTERYAYLKLP